MEVGKCRAPVLGRHGGVRFAIEGEEEDLQSSVVGRERDGLRTFRNSAFRDSTVLCGMQYFANRSRKGEKWDHLGPALAPALGGSGVFAAPAGFEVFESSK